MFAKGKVAIHMFFLHLFPKNDTDVCELFKKNKLLKKWHYYERNNVSYFQNFFFLVLAAVEISLVE